MREGDKELKIITKQTRLVKIGDVMIWESGKIRILDIKI